MMEIIIIFYLIIVLQLIHLGNLAIPIINFKEIKGRERPSFSIVVAARNEYNNLKKLLPILLDQDYQHFEIVVALDRCTDDSSFYLQDLQIAHSNIKVLEIDQVSEGLDPKKHAISLAIKASAGDWVLLTDADCQPRSSHWIVSFAASITPDCSILLGVGPYKKKASILNHFIQYETVCTAARYISMAIRKNPYMAVGRNLAYKRDLFLSKEGFRPYEKITGGDDDLFIQKYANSKNTGIVLGADSLTFTEAPDSLSAFTSQKLRHLHIGKYYKDQWIHVYWTLIHALLWLGFISLMLLEKGELGVIFPFILLILIKGLTFNLLSRRMGYYFNPFFLPVSDMIYSILYPFLGVVALLLRKVKWK